MPNLKKIHKLWSYVGNSGVYLCAAVIPMLLNLLTNPLMAMNMSPEDYAIVGYYKAFNNLISPLILFYMLHYYMKIYFEVDEKQRIYIKATIFKALIFFSFFLSVLCLIVLGVYCTYAPGEESIPLLPYLFLSVFSLPFTGICILAQTEYRMERRSRAFFVLSVSQGVLLVGGNLLLVVGLKWGAFGSLLAPLIVNSIFFSWCCIKYRELFKIRFDWKKLKQIVSFCAPLTLAAMLGFFSNGYDRVFLASLGDVSELGNYVVGVQIASYILVFQGSIAATFQPDIYQATVQKNYKKLAKIVGILLISLTVIVIVFIAIAPFVVDMLTAGRYPASVKYAQIAALSSIAALLYYTISQITIVQGKTRITLINKILSSILTVILFYYLISNFHYIGAAWGLVLSFLISFVLNVLLLFLERKRYFFKSSK